MKSRHGTIFDTGTICTTPYLMMMKTNIAPATAKIVT